MCGIAGIVNLGSTRPLERQDIVPMLSAIQHRGPDGSDLFLSQERNVGFGFLRLGLVDMVTGMQPMSSYDKRLTIVFNGEIYNHTLHRKALQSEGFRFATRSDTEVLLTLFQAEGVAAFPKLNGEFAFAVYDHEDKSVTIARDRFGMKPLYYYQNGRRLFFCSEIKGLFAHPEVPRKLNFRTVVEQLHRADSLERTAFEDIKILKPGHFLRISREGVITENVYWDLDLPTKTAEENSTLTFAEAVAETKRTVEKAILSRMEADFPVGAFLSGGLDSSIIATCMQGASTKPIDCYTIQFEDPRFDESDMAESLATHIGAAHHRVRVTNQDLVTHFPKAFYHAEHFVQQLDGTAKMLLSKTVRQGGVKAVMVGEGADDLFLGYPWFQLADTLERTSAISAQDWKKMIAKESTPLGLDLVVHEHRDLSRWIKRFGYYPISAANVLEMIPLSEGLFAGEFAARAAGTDPFLTFAEDLHTDRLLGRSLLRQNQYEFIKKTLPYYIFQFLGGKMEMAYGIEGRVPFLDNEVVALANRIPSRLHLMDGSEKSVVRAAFRDRLPAQVVNRRKHGYSAPILQPFLDAKPEYFEALLSHDYFKEVGFFHKPAFDLLFKKTLRAEVGSQDRLLRERIVVFVLSVHLMHEQMIKRRSHL